MKPKTHVRLTGSIYDNTKPFTPKLIAYIDHSTDPAWDKWMLVKITPPGKTEWFDTEAQARAALEKILYPN